MSDSVYQIPKVIHYCWFGGGEKPESVKKCIETWRNICPDFEIKEWNESNYDINNNSFIQKAYKDKKWAFVSDYARLDILYQYGGIYLDTDVEVLKNLSPLCEFKAYMGFENDELVNDGQGFGCEAGNQIIREMMDYYLKNQDGDTNKLEDYIESPKLRTEVLIHHGLRKDGSRQTIEDVEILPSDYLCPMDYDTGRMNITDNTYSIHHFDASWHGKGAKKSQLLMRLINRIFGKKLGRKIFVFIMRCWNAVKKLIGR